MLKNCAHAMPHAPAEGMDALEWFLTKMRVAKALPGMTQRKLGEAIGVNQSMVSRYLTYEPGEQGAPMPSLDVAMRLAALVGEDHPAPLEQASTQRLAELLLARLSGGEAPKGSKVTKALETYLHTAQEAGSSLLSGVFALPPQGGSLVRLKGKGAVASLGDLALQSPFSDLTEGPLFALRLEANAAAGFTSSPIYLLRALKPGAHPPAGAIVLFKESPSGKHFLGRYSVAEGKGASGWILSLPLDSRNLPFSWQPGKVCLEAVCLAIFAPEPRG